MRKERQKVIGRRELIYPLSVGLLAGSVGGFILGRLTPQSEVGRAGAEDFIGEVVKTPSYEIVDPQQFVRDGWLEPVELPTELAAKPVTEIAQFFMNRLTEGMLMLQYQPFRETASTLLAHASESIPTNGAIFPRIEALPVGEAGAWIFGIRPRLAESKTWVVDLVMNASLLNPRIRYTSPTISSLWVPVNLAIALSHEILGHYKLYSRLIPHIS